MTIQTFLRSARALATASLAALTLSAVPAQAEFTGGGYIYSLGGCEEAGFPVGTQMVRSRYAATETDGTNSIVLFFAVGGANTYTIPGAGLEPARAFRRATGTSTWGAQYTMSPAPTIRVTERETVVPMARFRQSRVDENSRAVRLQLTIRNFNGVSGCAVNAVLTMARWN